MSRLQNRSNQRRIAWIEKNVSFIRNNKDNIIAIYDDIKNTEDMKKYKPHEMRYLIEYISLKIQLDEKFAEEYFEHIKANKKDTEATQEEQNNEAAPTDNM